METAFHSSWTGDAKTVCRRAIERHGGWQAWQELKSVRLKPVLLDGLIPRMKGYPKSFHMPEIFEVFPHERRVVFHGFPHVGREASYQDGKLLIPLAQGQDFVLENARQPYKGFHKLAKWQDRDSLYFFGYALAGYLSFPFVFPELKLIAQSVYKTKTETWDVLTVEFPQGFDTHSLRQSFYFDSSGLLRRNDYCAEIISKLAMGAHYSFEYHKVHGVEVALQRRVFARIGRSALPLVALVANLELVD